MYNSTLTTDEKITLLEVKSGTCKGESVTYRFYSLRTSEQREYYAVEVTMAEKGELAALGDEYAFAKEFFGMIADGSVTPVTLNDLLADGIMSKKY